MSNERRLHPQTGLRVLAHASLVHCAPTLRAKDRSSSQGQASQKLRKSSWNQICAVAVVVVVVVVVMIVGTCSAGLKSLGEVHGVHDGFLRWHITMMCFHDHDALPLS